MRDKRIPTLGLVTALFWFSMYAYVSGLPTHAVALGADSRMQGLVLGAYGFTQMLVRVPLGIWSDTLRKRKLFVQLGMLISLLAALGMGFAQTPGALLLFRGLSGVAAGSWVTYSVLFSSYYSEDRSTHAIGTITSIMYLGQLLSMLLGGALGDWNPKAPFFLAVCAGAIGLALSVRCRDNAPTTPPLSMRSMLSVALYPTLLIVSLLSVLTQFVAFSTIYGFTTTLAKERFAASQQQLSMVTVLYTLCNMIAARMAGSFAAPRIGERMCAVLGFLMIGISVLFVPLTRGMGELYVTQCVAGLGMGLASSMLMALVLPTVPAEKRGAAMGFYQSIYGLGMFTGPVVAGMLVTGFGLSVNFFAMAALAAVGSLLAFRLLPGRKPASNIAHVAKP